MNINGGYSDLWKAIIRPARENYHISDLGILSTLIFKDPHCSESAKEALNELTM